METRSFGASVLLVFQKYCLHFAQISNGNPASVVFERLLLNSTSTLAHIADRVSSKPNRKKQCLAFMKCFTYCSVPTTCLVLSETSFFFPLPTPFSQSLVLLHLPTFHHYRTHLWICFCLCPTKIGLGLSGVPFESNAMQCVLLFH